MSKPAPVAPAPVQTRQKAAPASASLSGLLQRKCACGQHTVAGGECEACRQKREGMLQRAAVNATPTASNGVPSIVHDVLSSPGQPLDAGTRAFMEPRFGHDFSQVRVHTDARAAASAQAVNALAYTVGRDVVFGAGQYAPGMSSGRQLLAHELVHTIQQGSSNTAKLAAKADGIALSSSQEAEREADVVAQDITTGQREAGISVHQPAPALQRQPVFSSPAVTVRSPVAEELFTQESDIEAFLTQKSDVSTGNSRPLLSSEIALARPIFGNAIDYSRVRLIPAVEQLKFRTVGNNIRIPHGFTISNADDAENFIHELTHVWQYQHAGTSYISVSLATQIVAAIKTPSRAFAYKYQIAPDKSFFSFTPEQQGMLVQNYFAMQRDLAHPNLSSYRGNQPTLEACSPYNEGCFPELSWQDRQAEIARELPLHEPLIKQMQAALPRTEADILYLRASEVMQTPHEELVPPERRMPPIKPFLQVNF
ncbi:MAG TPA: DUF4157 domain-containing protein [Ktedonobacterales bacterium]